MAAVPMLSSASMPKNCWLASTTLARVRRAPRRGRPGYRLEAFADEIEEYLKHEDKPASGARLAQVASDARGRRFFVPTSQNMRMPMPQCCARPAASGSSAAAGRRDARLGEEYSSGASVIPIPFLRASCSGSCTGTVLAMAPYLSSQLPRSLPPPAVRRWSEDPPGSFGTAWS